VEKQQQCSSPEHEWCDPINDSGLVYRTQYLVVSRTLMEAMPKEWQHRFVDLMDQVREEFDFFHPDWGSPRYTVVCKNHDGRIMQDPWGRYRYPNSEMIEKLRNKAPLRHGGD
jgi:hypothetical protein